MKYLQLQRIKGNAKIYKVIIYCWFFYLTYKMSETTSFASESITKTIYFTLSFSIKEPNSMSNLYDLLLGRDSRPIFTLTNSNSNSATLGKHRK